jgi:hypothetical protein
MTSAAMIASTLMKESMPSDQPEDNTPSQRDSRYAASRRYRLTIIPAVAPQM